MASRGLSLRYLSAGAAALIALAVFAAPALAHAELVRSTPDANASLSRSPAQVEIFFSERVDPSLSSITVLNTNGAQVDSRDNRVDPADPTRLTVSLPALPDGVYTVSWRVLSATDGHVTTGAFPFAVGQAVPASALASTAAPATIRLSVGEVGMRWLSYLASAILLGGLAFTLWVWQPVRAALALNDLADLSADGAVGRLWPLIALGLGLLGNLLALLAKAGEVVGADIAAPWSPATATTLLDTRYGALWLAHLVSLLLTTLLVLRARSRRGQWLAILAALTLPLTLSLGSHAAGEASPWLPVISDWAHGVAASVWVGGVLYFVLALGIARQLHAARRTQLVALLIPRFSTLALVSVGALTLTGLYASVLRVGTFEHLFGTVYGQLLILKLLIAAPMVALGAVNLLWTTPRLKKAALNAKGDGSLVARFRRLVSTEVMLGVALLLTVGLLTAAPPAQASGSDQGYTNTASADDLQLTLDLNPARVGVNTFTVTVLADGQPVDTAQQVTLRFTPSGVDVPPSQAQLAGQGQGRYQIKGAFLSLPAQWQIQAVVRREGQFDAYANFDITVGTNVPTATIRWAWVTGGLTLAVAGLLLWIVILLGRSRPQQIGFGVVPALALAASAVLVFARPDPAGAALPVNPVLPNAASVAAGRAIYMTNCVPCHGETGKGDGPVGLTLNPRPADLTIHAVPGVHPDGQLYDWITNGFPANRVMPAFGKNLSEEDRWNLVNFIRTFAQR